MAENVFITGADKGLGLCLADRFVRAGYRVFAGQYGDGAELALLAAEFPATLTAIPLDVSSMPSIVNAAGRVSDLTDQLDYLVNCAGLSIDIKVPLPELDLANGNLESIMAVNAFGPLRVTQAFLPMLDRGQRKRIVNISSEAGSIGENWRDVGYGYCMSKAAFNMQSQILQRYLKPRGFRVLIFHPGWMRTTMGGPDAHISPEESAAGIFKLATEMSSANEPAETALYQDYTGRKFAW